MIKYNFSVLKNRNIKVGYKKDGSIFTTEGILKNVKTLQNHLVFCFEDGRQLEVTGNAFYKSLIRREDDIISIIYDPECGKISGMIGFTMSDTYGFPIEMTAEILKEKGKDLDIEGANVLKELQKENSRKNSNFNNAF